MSNDKYNTGPDDLVTRLAALEARVSLLETVPNLGSATIDTGTLRVRDNTKVVQVELGLLSDGTYGLNVKEPNPSTVFHQVPYIYTNFIQAGETCTSATYGDLATVGPQVTVPVGTSGNILIIATAQIQWNTSLFADPIGDGRFDVAFSGANTRTPNEVSDPLVGILRLNSGNNAGSPISGIAAYGSFTAQAVFSGLTPGNTTITMKYRRESDTNADPVQFFRRTLTVFRL